MNVALLSLVTAALFATSVVVSRIGMKSVTNSSIGVYWSVVATFVSLLGLGAIRGFEVLSPRATVFVVFAGLSASVLGRLFSFNGALSLGPSRSVAIQSATYPTITVIAGLLVFSESFGLRRAGGILLVLVALYLIVSDPRKAAAASIHDSVSGENRLVRSSGYRFLFPVASGFFYASADLLRKAAANELADPLTGAAIGVAAALAAWTVIVASTLGVRTLTRVGSGIGYFALSGVIAAFAVWGSFAAFASGDASIVGPLIATQPIFVAATSAALLGNLESRSPRTLVAIIFVTLGGSVLSRT
jgi:drug/metabolite transporter (DMT)-like permease